MNDDSSDTVQFKKDKFDIFYLFIADLFKFLLSQILFI